MIDRPQLEQALQVVGDLSMDNRLSLLDALTRLPLTDDAWRAASPLIRLVLADLEARGLIEGAADILARVPVRSVRQSLRRLAGSEEDETARAAALALARVRDPSGLSELMRDFHESLSPDVGQALAGLPLEDLGVRREDIDPGLSAPDDMTRLWTAIASARVRDDKGYYWEPLEQLWDSLVRPPGFFRQSQRDLLFLHPPRLFDKDARQVIGELGSVRPLPDAVRLFIVDLQQNDFEGWTPRQPAMAQDSLAARAFVAGITGDAKFIGGALPASPQTIEPDEPSSRFAARPAEKLQRFFDLDSTLGETSNDDGGDLIKRLLDMTGESRAAEGYLMNVDDIFGEPQPVANLIDDLWTKSKPSPRPPRSAPPPAAPEATPPPPPSSEPSLHFVLEGEHARGAAMLANSNAELIFQFDIPPNDVLAVANNVALDNARKADIDIELRATARGAISLVGARIGTASFRGGRMIKPVPFPIHAGPSADADSSVHVDFSVKGESVYQIEMPIRVVALREELGRAPAGPSPEQTVPLDLMQDALTTAEPPRQRIQLSLSFNGGKFCIELTDYRDGEIEFQQQFVSKEIDRGRVETLLKSVNTELEPSYKDTMWSRFDGSIPSGEDGRVIVAALKRTLNTVAVGGSRLNKDLRTDEAIAKALDYVEENGAQGAVITVTTDDIFLPWEILYPESRSANMTQAQKDKNPVQPNRFWGARFAIETVQRGSGSLGKLRQRQLACAPAVSLNLNPTISFKDLDQAEQPIVFQQAWAKRLKSEGHLGGLHETCDEVRSVLQDASEDATLIYVYCHGNASNPFGGVDESLTLDADCCLQPSDLDEGPPYKNAPIIFLNSCMAGAFSPMTFSNFLAKFRKRDALGMIATTYAVPIMFGSRFGQEVVDCCVRRRGSLAVALLELRRKHLLERGDPVPLFYSLQCQIDFGAR